jgi:filamentous hemagglutinin
MSPERIIAHAVLGCVQQASSGGQCGPGAAAAAFGKIATGLTEGLGEAAQFAVTTVVGGTVSVIGGGKFANGAVQAAFGYLFNSLSKPTNTYEVGVRQAILRGDAQELRTLLGNGVLSVDDALIAQRALAGMESLGASNSAMLSGRYGVNWVNRVHHIFEGVHQGPVGQALLGRFGSPLEAMAQVQRAVEVAKPATGMFSNTFRSTVNVQGIAVQVRGAVVDGVYKIGTIQKW